MKIAILAAGTSNCFPLFIDRPKCLYHLDGEVQLERVIKVAESFVEDNDIIVVAGYKYKYIYNYLKKHHPHIEFRVNYDYAKAAIYSLRKAVENVDDDVVFMLGDENISEKNVARICSSDRKMAIMCHDTFYYYSVGIMKLRKDAIPIVNDDCYLSLDYIKEIYCFAHNKNTCDEILKMNSGVCLGYTTIDFVRRIGKIEKVENPVTHYNGDDIDFIHFVPEDEYIPDVDHFYDTDEYKNSSLQRFYSDYVSDTIKSGGRLVKKAVRKIKKQI